MQINLSAMPHFLASSDHTQNNAIWKTRSHPYVAAWRGPLREIDSFKNGLEVCKP